MIESKSADGIYYEDIGITNEDTPPIENHPTYDPHDQTPNCGESFINAIITTIYLCYWFCCIEKD
jgi:hypothetical protein